MRVATVGCSAVLGETRLWSKNRTTLDAELCIGKLRTSGANVRLWHTYRKRALRTTPRAEPGGSLLPCTFGTIVCPSYRVRHAHDRKPR
jgi:hypothetical protein